MGNFQDKPESERFESNASAPNTPKHERISKRMGGDKFQLSSIQIEKKQTQESIANNRSVSDDSDVNESGQTMKLNSPTHKCRDINNELEPFRSIPNIENPNKYSIQIDTNQLESLESILNKHTSNKRNIRVEVNEIGPSSQRAEPHQRNIRIEADQLETIRTVLQSFRPKRENIRIGVDNIESLKYILKSLTAKRQNIPRGPDVPQINERALSRHYISTDSDFDPDGAYLDQFNPKKYEMRVKSDKTESSHSKSGGLAINRRNIRIEFDKIDTFETPDRYYLPMETDVRERTRPTLHRQASSAYSVQKNLDQIEPEMPTFYRESLGRFNTPSSVDQITPEEAVYYKQKPRERDIPSEVDQSEPMGYVLKRSTKKIFREMDQLDSRGPVLNESLHRQQIGPEELQPVGYLVNNTRHNLQRGTHRLKSQGPLLYKEIPDNSCILREDEPVGYRLNDNWYSMPRESDQFELVRPVLYRTSSQSNNVSNEPYAEPAGYTLNSVTPNRYYTQVESDRRDSTRYVLNTEPPHRQNSLGREQYGSTGPLYYRPISKTHNMQRYTEQLESDRPMLYKQTQNRRSFLGETVQRESAEATSYRDSRPRHQKTDLENPESIRPAFYHSTESRYSIPRDPDEDQSIGYLNNPASNWFESQVSTEELEALKSSVIREPDECATVGSVFSLASSNKRHASIESDNFKSNRPLLKARSPSEYSIREESDLSDSEFSKHCAEQT